MSDRAKHAEQQDVANYLCAQAAILLEEASAFSLQLSGPSLRRPLIDHLIGVQTQLEDATAMIRVAECLFRQCAAFEERNS
jgi:hypothetical protein